MFNVIRGFNQYVLKLIYMMLNVVRGFNHIVRGVNRYVFSMVFSTVMEINKETCICCVLCLRERVGGSMERGNVVVIASRNTYFNKLFIF